MSNCLCILVLWEVRKQRNLMVAHAYIPHICSVAMHYFSVIFKIFPKRFHKDVQIQSCTLISEFIIMRTVVCRRACHWLKLHMLNVYVWLIAFLFRKIRKNMEFFSGRYGQIGENTA